MSCTFSDAPIEVITNLKELQRIWKERCVIIENNIKGNYSRHLLLILHDLREEIENNKYIFSQNSYAKKFFKIQFNSYCTYRTSNIDPLGRIKRYWAEEVNQELCFITEALSDQLCRFELEDILILLQSIENKLTSENSFEKIIKKLYKELFEKKINFNHIEFLVDTIIILFNNKGMVEIKEILDDQLEKFEDISIIDEENYTWFASVFGTPPRNADNINDYKECVKKYYEILTIEQRLSFLKEIYCQKPQGYKVIFNITGLKFSQKINIGNVEFYNPKIDGKYIKDNKYNIDFENGMNYCVAVNIEGIDSNFIKNKAQKMIERTIAILSSRTKKDQAILLSKDWIICDAEGNIKSYNFKYKDNNTTNIKIEDAEIENNLQRVGEWISSEKICHPTITKWLSSTDWYRLATESLQSSQEILNSWFAVEKFSEDSRILSKTIPQLSKLLKNDLSKEVIDLWLEGDKIKTIQLLLVINELKFNIYVKVMQFKTITVFPFTDNEFVVSKYINELLKDYLADTNENKIDILDKLIEIIPVVKTKLNIQNIESPLLESINNIFYDHKKCEKYLIENFIMLKDDVYNIYRIRNMLVHSSNTQSKLLDYYAKRCREYSHSLLDAIAYKIYQTSNDDEIMPLEFYFREMIINTSIALEAVKANKMDKFKNWVLQ